jgi:hypothetical protein
MRAIFPRSLMQTHPQGIVRDTGLNVCATLEPSAASTEKEVDDDQCQNQADAASAVVPDSWAHVVAATAEDK